MVSMVTSASDMSAICRISSMLCIANEICAATSPSCSTCPCSSTDASPAMDRVRLGAGRSCAWSKRNGSFQVDGLMRTGALVLVVVVMQSRIVE